MEGGGGISREWRDTRNKPRQCKKKKQGVDILTGQTDENATEEKAQ